MLRPSEEAAAIQAQRPVVGYTDPLLKNNRRQYIQFAKRCKSIGLVEYSLACQCEVGIYFS